MTRRPGLSLVEVLVALFIMGIGTIAVLTLFPLGALNMAQALRDDRCTQAASQADAYLRYYVKSQREQPVGRTDQLAQEEFFKALTDPGSTTVSGYLMPIAGQSPSYAVVIDPMGYRARGGTDATVSASWIAWVGDKGFGDNSVTKPHTSALPRRTLKRITDHNASAADTALQLPLALRTCTLLDGLGYDTMGQPATVPGGTTTVDRDVRYNWLWVVQKLDNSGTQAKVTVVVFDRRAPNYAPPGVDLENVFTPSVAQVGLTQLSFNPAATTPAVPPVQRGGWLLDASVALLDRAKGTVVVPTDSPPLPAGVTPWIRNAHFYRVMSTTENAAGGLDVELDVPLREDTGRDPAASPAEPQLQPQHRRFIYLSGVAEVFVRPLPLDL